MTNGEMMAQAATATLILIVVGGLVLAALVAVIGTLRVRLSWDREDQHCDEADEAAWIAAQEAALERAMATLLERNLRKAEEDRRRRRRAERMRRQQKLRRSDLAQKRREIRHKQIWRELDRMMIAMAGRPVAIKEAA